ncbi:MAG: hypothetical protein R6X18_07215 [Chloroflexota bacterium]|jgi:hypothetical protein
MITKPHIVRLVADEVSRVFYHHRPIPHASVRPRILDEEIGVEFESGDFIPYADLGYSCDIGFFRLSGDFDVANDSLPYAAAGQLINYGQVLVTASVSQHLSNDDIRNLLQRHTSGDYGEFGEFYELDITDGMLMNAHVSSIWSASQNKVNTLTGLETITSEYVVDTHRIRVITEAGEDRTTVILFAGTIRD